MLIYSNRIATLSRESEKPYNKRSSYTTILSHDFGSRSERRMSLLRPGVVKQLTHSLTHPGSRSEVDLIDMQSSSHKSQYRWIMVYQCLLTKFCILRALTSKRPLRLRFSYLIYSYYLMRPVVCNQTMVLSLQLK